MEGLQKLNIAVEDIDYVIVTHIHLDHAGGAGLFLQSCPNAKLVVHPRGATHMIDPSRLIRSAKGVYGAEFDRLLIQLCPLTLQELLKSNTNSYYN